MYVRTPKRRVIAKNPKTSCRATKTSTFDSQFNLVHINIRPHSSRSRPRLGSGSLLCTYSVSHNFGFIIQIDPNLRYVYIDSAFCIYLTFIGAGNFVSGFLRRGRKCVSVAWVNYIKIRVQAAVLVLHQTTLYKWTYIRYQKVNFDAF